MEDPQNKTINRDKKKMTIKLGGGGGGGVLLLGGVLATATLVSAAFAFRRKIRGSTDNNQPPSPQEPLVSPPNNLKIKEKNNDDEIDKGLSFLLPDSSPAVNHHPRIDGTEQVGVTEIDVSTQNLILDEKPKLDINGGAVDPTTCGDDEIFFSDILEKPENMPLFGDDSGVPVEKSLSPVMNSPPLLKHDMVKTNPSSEEMEVTMEDEAIKADQIAAKNNSERPLNSQQAEEEERYEEKITVDKFEEVVEVSNAAAETELNQELVCSDRLIEGTSTFEKPVSAPLFDVSGVTGEDTSFLAGSSLLEDDTMKKKAPSEEIEATKENEAIEAAYSITTGDDPEKPLDSLGGGVEEEDDDHEKIILKKCDMVEAAVEMQLAEELEKCEEILCSDNYSFENFVVKKQYLSFSPCDNPSVFIPESVTKHQSLERLMLVQPVEITEGGKAIEASQSVQLQFKEEEKEEKIVGGIMVEKCEEAVETVSADQIGGKDGRQFSEEPKTLANGDQEGISTKSSLQGIGTPEKHAVNKLEFSLPLLVESVEIAEGDEAIEVAQDDQMVTEDNPLLQQLNEEEAQDGKIIVEKCEAAVETVHADQFAEIDVQQVESSEDPKALANGNIFFGSENVDDSAEPIPPLEAADVMKEDEPAEKYNGEITEGGKAIEASQSVQLQFKEEEKEEKHVGEIMVEKCEEAFETVSADQIGGKDGRQFSEEPVTLANDYPESISIDSSLQGISTPEKHGVNKQEFSLPLLVESVENAEGNEAVEVAQDDEMVTEVNPCVQKLTKEEAHDGKIDVEKCEAAVETVHADQFAEIDVQQVESNEDPKALPNGNLFCGYENVDDSAEDIPSVEASNVMEDDESAEKYDGEITVEEAVETNSPVQIQVEHGQQFKSAKAFFSTEIVKVMEEDEAIESAVVDQVAVVANECGEYDNTKESIEMTGGEEFETTKEDMVGADNNPQAKLNEEEEEGVIEDDDDDELEDDDDDDDNDADMIEEGSAGTGDSSVDSNAEAIWPVERVQKWPLKFDELKIDNQKSGEKNVEEDGMMKKEEHNFHNNKESDADDHNTNNEVKRQLAMNFLEKYTTELATSKDQPKDSRKLRVWIWSSLLPLWCLCYCYFDLPILNVCIIAAMSVILLKVTRL